MSVSVKAHIETAAFDFIFCELKIFRFIYIKGINHAGIIASYKRSGNGKEKKIRNEQQRKNYYFNSFH